MSKISDLPGGGYGFRLSSGAGNFTKKFTQATKFGALRNLSDNRASILKVIEKNKSKILGATAGKFGRLAQRQAFSEVKKLEGNRLTKDDKKEIKQLFKHLGAGKKDLAEQEKTSRSLVEMQRDEGFDKERLERAELRLQRYSRNKDNGVASESALKFASEPEEARVDAPSVRKEVVERRLKPRVNMVKDKIDPERFKATKAASYMSKDGPVKDASSPFDFRAQILKRIKKNTPGNNDYKSATNTPVGTKESEYASAIDPSKEVATNAIHDVREKKDEPKNEAKTPFVRDVNPFRDL